jgi:ABC-type lipoprotein release transport system permease subunit
MSRPRAPAPARSRLRAGDLIPIGTIGLRTRRLRAALSALGIAIGIAAVVSVLGITRSSESALLAEIDRAGTNLLTVANGQSVGGGEAELPIPATAMIRRVAGVAHVAPTALINVPGVFRTDRVPVFETGGLAVRAADPSLLGTLGATLRQGAFLNAATEKFPVTVLGFDAARNLGVANLGRPVRVYIAGRWFQVAGILNPTGLAPEIDRSALVGFPVAARLLGYDGHPSRLYVRTAVDDTVRVASLLGPSANPESPGSVGVSRPSDALAARIAVAGAATALFVGLGAVALLVGGVGIANVMVIAVLERRAEIGLRRALGATRGHIAAQFLTECLVLGTIGGTVGLVIGVAVTAWMARVRHWGLLVPPVALWGGLGVAVVIGVVAGLYPAARAARLSPIQALRSV